MPEPILQFQNVDFQWDDDTTPILRDFTWELQGGEAYCLDEPSGKGKTTFLKLAAKLLRPTRGKIHCRAPKIGFVFQDQRLLPWLTTYENLKIAMPHPEDRRIRDMLQALGLQDKATQPASTLSGGEAQRVNLIRALLNNPMLLLLDEPFNGLDDKNATIAQKLILDWKNQDPNHALILATHIASFQNLANAKILHFHKLSD